MKSRHPKPTDNMYWYALAVLAAVGTTVLVYQSRRDVSTSPNEFAATAAVLRESSKLDDKAVSQIRYSILNHTNLEKAIRRMGLSANGGIGKDLEKAKPESAKVLARQLNVDVAADTQPGWCRIGITCKDPHRPERAICIANYLAQHYASVYRTARRERLKTEQDEAVRRTSVAKREWNEAKGGFIGFVDRHFNSLAKHQESAQSPRQPSPGPPPGLRLQAPRQHQADKPEQTAADEKRDARQLEQLQRRLTFLEERRDELSEKLKPAHPELAAVAEDITILQKRVKLLRDKTEEPQMHEASEREIAEPFVKQPAAGSVVVPTFDVTGHRKQFESHRATLTKLEKSYRDAVAGERMLAAASGGQDPVKVNLALGCQVVSAPARLNFKAILGSGFAGLVVGLGIVLLGRSRTVFKPITTPEEAEAALGVPVAGIVPRSTTRSRHHSGNTGILLALFAVLLIIAAIAFVWGASVGVL